MTAAVRDEGLVRQGHARIRMTLRIVGPSLLVVGILLGAYGIFWSSGQADTYELGDDGWFEEKTANSTKAFFLIAGGMGLFFVGLVLTMYGYMGAVARYSASEVAPVGTDTINYVGHHGRPGFTAIGSAIGGGMATTRGGGAKTVVRCHKCNDENAADAKFCDECGTALAKTKACASCGELNDPDARFCDDCGTRLS